MSIPQTFIQELLNRADVVDVVGRHVALKRAGANYLGLCPFHGEKSPSFTVSPAKQFYHCFGCGKNGNAIGFLMEQLGSTFVEAVHDLAGQYGLQVPQDQRSAQDRAREAALKSRQARIQDVLAGAAKYYQEQLPKSQQATRYLKGRGLSEAVIQTFGMGYAPKGGRALANTFADYSDPLLVESGLVILPAVFEPTSDAKRYDRFRDRVVFPIRSIKGEVIGFGARVLDNSLPKYLNSPETAVFSKGHELYGLFEARNVIRERGYCLVTEGYMDVVALAQLGFANAVATLGTACTREHVQKLTRHTDAVVFSFDGDAAGERAAKRALVSALPFATDTRSFKFLFLPQEHDPDSFVRQQGAQAFEKYVLSATPLSTFLIQVASEGCDLGTAEGRAKCSRQSLPLWNALPDGALKRQIITTLSKHVQISARDLIDLGSGERATPSLLGVSKHRARATHLPTSRADHALRLLLTENAAWGRLCSEEHRLLCELPAPHGEVFSWLDHQHMEHGSQNWAALSSAMQAQSFCEFAHEQVRMSIRLGEEFNIEELQKTLRSFVLEEVKKNRAQAAVAHLSNPQDAHKRTIYQELLQREKALMGVALSQI